MLQDDLGRWRLTVRPAEAGRRLDVFLAGRCRCSRSEIHRCLAEPVTDAAGQRLKWSRRLSSGDIVLIARLRRPEPDVQVRYRILASDDWLVAVDKGPGAPVHPARSFRTRTILTRLRAELDDPRLAPAHRIDRETSGVLLFGRTREAASALAGQFAARQVAKRYLAVVRGRCDFDRIRLDSALERDPDFPIRCRMRPAAGAGLAARTEVEVLARSSDCSLVRARPQTGRMHQIRVHLAAAGHPLLGDKLYQEDGLAYLALIEGGLDERWLARLGHTRLALHAEALAFVHPGTGERCELSAPLPADLEALLGRQGAWSAVDCANWAP